MRVALISMGVNLIHWNTSRVINFENEKKNFAFFNAAGNLFHSGNVCDGVNHPLIYMY